MSASNPALGLWECSLCGLIYQGDHSAHFNDPRHLEKLDQLNANIAEANARIDNSKKAHRHIYNMGKCECGAEALL